nr:nucleoredoxin-like [Lytechinus pictus]
MADGYAVKMLCWVNCKSFEDGCLTKPKERELHIQYKVKGIPLLLILDSVTGEVVCKNAGNELKTDPEGKKFPWKLRPLSDILAGNVIDNEMKTLSLDNLKGKVLGIYFSAHWCPPCKTFTPVLKGTYEKIKETGQPFEIIFATKDQKEDSFKSYFAEMPWLAFPFQDERIEELSKSLSVLGIPMLVIIDAEGKLITTEGRGSVMQDPEGKNFPWYPPACCELDSFSASIVNEGPCLILFTEIEEGDDDEYSRKALEMMKPVAEEIRAAEEAKGKEPACKFIVAGDDDMVESLQQFLSIADESLPMLALLNIPREQVSCCEGKEITPDLIREYYHKFVSDELEWTSLS